MDIRNETSLRGCRFLNDKYFQERYAVFTEAFSDYVIPFALTELQFRNHINLTAVDLHRTVGFIDAGRMIGFSLNGFGDWNGLSTVYDAGTGVLPSSRRQGISERMFEMMLPEFRKAGIEQFLLEVITTNINAIKLYEKLGFTATRRLALLQCDGRIKESPHPLPNIEIRELQEVDWGLAAAFKDGEPSWQNSVQAIKRTSRMKRFFGAFQKGEFVGFVVFSSKFGRVAQIAVSRDYRCRGIGTALVRTLQNETANGYSLQIINIDTALSSSMEFFINRGFYERLNQYEMMKMI